MNVTVARGLPVQSESTYLGDVLKYEAPNLFSRDEVTLTAGNLALGAVVGRRAPAVTVTPGTNTGNGVMGAVTLGPAALAGNYLLTCKTKVTNAGVFSVVDPRGLPLPDLTVAVGMPAITSIARSRMAAPTSRLETSSRSPSPSRARQASSIRPRATVSSSPPGSRWRRSTRARQPNRP